MDRAVVPLVVLASTDCGDDVPPGALGVDGLDAGPETSARVDATSDAAVEASAPTESFSVIVGAGKDEDPSLVRASDGVFHPAWYSNRDGSDRIWMRTSMDGLLGRTVIDFAAQEKVRCFEVDEAAAARTLREDDFGGVCVRGVSWCAERRAGARLRREAARRVPSPAPALSFGAGRCGSS